MFGLLHFFYQNKLYKNNDSEIGEKNKNILNVRMFKNKK